MREEDQQLKNESYRIECPPDGPDPDESLPVVEIEIEVDNGEYERANERGTY